MLPNRDRPAAVPSPSWPLVLSPQLATTWDWNTAPVDRIWAWAGPAAPPVSAMHPASTASPRDRRRILMRSPLVAVTRLRRRNQDGHRERILRSAPITLRSSAGYRPA